MANTFRDLNTRADAIAQTAAKIAPLVATLKTQGAALKQQLADSRAKELNQGEVDALAQKLDAVNAALAGILDAVNTALAAFANA